MKAMRRAMLASIYLPFCNAQDVNREITVTATRLPNSWESIPAAVSVIERDAVQLGRQQLGLDESLSAAAGVFLQDRYNFAQDLRMSIRGFGARANFGIRGVRIYVDGIPETLPDGQAQVDSIDLGSIEKITVIRGANSALYGNASGGVVFIESEAPAETPRAALRIAGGADGFSQQQAKFSGHLRDLGYSLSLQRLRYDGFRDFSRHESQSVNGLLQLPVNENGTLKAAVNHTDQPLAQDPGGLTLDEGNLDPSIAAPRALLFDTGESVRQTRVGLSYQHDLTPQSMLQLRNYYVWRDFSNKLAFQPGGAVFFERFFYGGGANYQRNLKLGSFPARFIVGFDFDQQRDDRDRFNNDEGLIGDLSLRQQEKVSTMAYFLQNEITLLDALQLQVGFRYDQIRFKVADQFLTDGNDSGERRFHEFSPSLGLSYRLAPAVNLYFNLSTAFETPTSTELANPEGGGFNLLLEPQLARHAEVGVKGQLDNATRYAIAAFDISAKDELVPFELPQSPGRAFFRNAGESQRRGLELELAKSLTPRLSASVAYTYSDFVFTDFIDADGTDFSDKRLPGLPRQLLQSSLLWRHPRGIYLGVDAIHVDQRFLNNANTAVDPSYVLTNMRAGHDIKLNTYELALFAGVNNLFDRRYTANGRINAVAAGPPGSERYFEPGPGINFYGGFELRWSR
jgi:iron complex outermembrane recepter protein